MYDSEREWERFILLRQMQDHDEISDLQYHHVFPIGVMGVWICDYEADFRYLDKSGNEIVEDVKPKFRNEKSRKAYMRTDAYQRFAQKKRLMLAVHGIDVTEI
jgi:hypothetical protein